MLLFLGEGGLVSGVQVRNLRLVPVEGGTVTTVGGGEDLLGRGDFFRGGPGGEGAGFAFGEIGATGAEGAHVVFLEGRVGAVS